MYSSPLISYHNYIFYFFSLWFVIIWGSDTQVNRFNVFYKTVQFSQGKKANIGHRIKGPQCVRNATAAHVHSSLQTLWYVPRILYFEIYTRHMTVETWTYLTASSCDAKSDSKLTILSSIGGSLFRSTSNSWPRIFT